MTGSTPLSPERTFRPQALMYSIRLSATTSGAAVLTAETSADLFLELGDARARDGGWLLTPGLIVTAEPPRSRWLASCGDERPPAYRTGGHELDDALAVKLGSRGLCHHLPRRRTATLSATSNTSMRLWETMSTA